MAQDATNAEGPDAILSAMANLEYRIDDLGDRRVLTLAGRTYPPTRYSRRVIEMLVERKQERAPLYFPFKETRGPLYLDPLLRWLRARDTDPHFVEIARAKVDELRLDRVREVRLFTNDETRRLPWPDDVFDLVLAIGVIEHLPRDRRAQVDEYYRVLAPGGHLAILDTPNRLFPLETHSIGLPLVQWMSPAVAFRYARLARPRKFGNLEYADFVADGTGWRNASLAECLPSSGWRGLEDLTEAAGYGWRFFRDTARSRTRRAALPLFAPLCAALAAARRPPSLALPYFNLLFRKRPGA